MKEGGGEGLGKRRVRLEGFRDDPLDAQLGGTVLVRWERLEEEGCELCAALGHVHGWSGVGETEQVRRRKRKYDALFLLEQNVSLLMMNSSLRDVHGWSGVKQNKSEQVRTSRNKSEEGGRERKRKGGALLLLVHNASLSVMNS